MSVRTQVVSASTGRANDNLRAAIRNPTTLCMSSSDPEPVSRDTESFLDVSEIFELFLYTLTEISS